MAAVAVQKPRGLTASAILMSFFALASYLFPWRMELQWLHYTGHAFIALCLTVTYFYWRGKNWARVLVLIFSILAIGGIWMIDIPNDGYFGAAIMLAEAALGAFLLYWLNTTSMRQFFKRRGDTLV